MKRFLRNCGVAVLVAIAFALVSHRDDSIRMPKPTPIFESRQELQRLSMPCDYLSFPNRADEKISAKNTRCVRASSITVGEVQ